MAKKRSFFERLTGGITVDDDSDFEVPDTDDRDSKNLIASDESWVEEDAELAVDMQETPSMVVIKTMTAGVRPEDLEIEITRDNVIIKGERKESHTGNGDGFHIKELYWGSFSRSINLPDEIDPDLAEASEKHGLLTIKLPKFDKNKKAQLKVKSS
jgi:HSP20 family protein